MHNATFLGTSLPTSAARAFVTALKAAGWEEPYLYQDRQGYLAEHVSPYGKVIFRSTSGQDGFYLVKVGFTDRAHCPAALWTENLPRRTFLEHLQQQSPGK